MKQVCVIGLGLLGGSFALALRKIYPDVIITGVDISQKHAETALSLGLVDSIGTLQEEIQQAQLIALATPVDSITEEIATLLDLVPEDSTLIDFGSTKHAICSQVVNHPHRERFIACHPIAGTENSGPKAAFPALFLEKMMIICDRELSHPSHLGRVEELFQKMNMRLEYMKSSAHDEHIAFVSHLSHISSFGLGATVLDIEKNEKNIFIMAGSGFDSTVRLAKSSPDMWTPIFSQNKENISKALGLYIQKLSEFKEKLDDDNQEEMHRFMSETNDIRRVLKDPDKE